MGQAVWGPLGRLGPGGVLVFVGLPRLLLVFTMDMEAAAILIPGSRMGSLCLGGVRARKPLFLPFEADEQR